MSLTGVMLGWSNYHCNYALPKIFSNNSKLWRNLYNIFEMSANDQMYVHRTGPAAVEC